MSRLALLPVLTGLLALLAAGCGTEAQNTADPPKVAENPTKDPGSPARPTDPASKHADPPPKWNPLPVQTRPNPGNPKDKMPQVKEIKGRVQSVDANHNRLTLQIDSNHEKTFDVQPGALVQSDSPRAPAIKGGLSGLGKGREVRLITTREGGHEVVTAILVK